MNLNWPSIEQLPKTLCENVTRILEYRLSEDEKKDEINKLFNQHCVATEKIDGTNFGKCCGGHYYGRRSMVTGFSYQKVSLCKLGKYDVANMKQDLLEGKLQLSKELQANVKEFRLYGELGCNKNLYDYAEKGYANEWTCFGANLYCQTPNERNEIYETLRSNGFATKTIKKTSDENIPLNEDQLEEQKLGCYRITILPCEKFFEFLDSHNVPHVPIAFQGTLLDLIKAEKEWMMQHNGEGHVVTINSSYVYKWKQGHERQSAGIDQLKGLIENNGKDLEPHILEGFQILYDIATKTPAPIESKKPKEKVVRVFPLDEKDIAEAIKSAGTKYDSIEKYFEENKKNEYLKLIMEECLIDLPLAKTNEDAAKQLQGALNKHVGVAFGKWKQKGKN